MELLFLLLLVGLMAAALASGFPVAFALPGSAILTIGLAAAAGGLFAGGFRRVRSISSQQRRRLGDVQALKNALANVDAICAVPGLDCVVIGANDLSGAIPAADHPALSSRPSAQVSRHKTSPCSISCMLRRRPQKWHWAATVMTAPSWARLAK